MKFGRLRNAKRRSSAVTDADASGGTATRMRSIGKPTTSTLVRAVERRSHRMGTGTGSTVAMSVMLRTGLGNYEIAIMCQRETE